MPRCIGPTQNELFDIFEGCLKHDVLSGHMFIYYLSYRSFTCISWFPGMCFHGVLACINMCISATICVFCFFFGSFSGICLFVLSHSDLFYSVLYNYYSLQYCHLRRHREGVNLDGRRDGEDPTGVVGGENAIRIILMKTIIFNKRKIKENSVI